MEFDWDTRKAAANRAKHSVDFRYAARIFLDPLRVVAEDRRRAYGEDRYSVLGEIEGRVYLVAYTERAGGIRIISARKGNKREQKKYYALRA